MVSQQAPGSASTNPRRIYCGIVFDEYTPQIENQILRDCLLLQKVADKQKYDELVIVCESARPEAVLRGLGIRRVPLNKLAGSWLVYKTGEYWPEVPGEPKLIYERDMQQKKTKSNLFDLSDDANIGYYLPPQGRLSPDTISLLRPAPNGYIPADPALLMLWSS